MDAEKLTSVIELSAQHMIGAGMIAVPAALAFLVITLAVAGWVASR